MPEGGSWSGPAWFGILGYPLSHSRSPAMHRAGFREAGIEAGYQAWPVAPEDLRRVVAGLRLLPVTGFNVTIPHKETIIPLLDGLDEEARRLGAVNTVKRDPDGRLIGYNTDSTGFMESLGEEVSGRTVLVLGAGGAARAVVGGLVAAGARVVVAAREGEKSLRLTEELGGETLPWEERESFLADCHLLVNATPVGQMPRAAETPIDLATMGSGGTVADLVYNPLETRLLREARQRALRTVDGLGMLVAQGAHAWRIWLDRDGPRAAFRSAVEVV